MKTHLKLLILVSLQALACCAISQTPALTPGMPAPKLEVGGWLKGSAPAAKKGRFRVVEFWATWCEPCINAMPHLSEIARKHKDRLDVIGISVLEAKTTTREDLEVFVSERTMDYLVAHDDKDGKAAMAWLIASEQTGIPVAFLLDDANRILWTGHPMSIDKPLKEAFAGTIDVEANKKAFIEAAVAQAELNVNWGTISKAAKQYQAGAKTEAEKAWGEVAAKSVRLAAQVRISKLGAYPLESSEFQALAETFIAGSDEEQAQLAQAAGQRGKSAPAEARRIVERVVRAAKDYLALYQAGLAYKALGLPKESIATLDLALATYEKSNQKDAVIDFKGMVQRAKQAS